MKAIRQLVDQCIEKELATYHELIGCSETTIVAIGEFIESNYIKNVIAGNSLSVAYEILLPKILTDARVNALQNENLNLSNIVEACEFACDYFHLRNLIHYSFAFESSVSWTLNGTHIDVRVDDPTIFRQYMSERHSFMMNSIDPGSSDALPYDKVLELLKGTTQADTEMPKVKRALKSIESHADLKLQHYLSGNRIDSHIDIGGFTFGEFLQVYRDMLIIALYERALSQANNLMCTLPYPVEEILSGMSTHTLIDAEKCSRIINAISEASGQAFPYLESGKKYMLFPFTFSLRDGVSDILRRFAKADEKGFSSRAAGPIGNTMCATIASYFTGFRNFRVIREVSLQKYGRHLPDIDLMLMSYEPSLGFHVFFCEVKNSLYATWAKEYLKSVGKKGFFTKAVSQVSLLTDFFNTDLGNELLVEFVMKEFKHLDLRKLFPTGFVVLKEYLIVSSQNIGMFHNELKMYVVSSQILQKIVKASDGDVAYMQGCLRTFNQTIDDSYEKSKSTLNAQGYTINADIMRFKHFIYFPEHSYLSTGEFEELERTALQTGYSYIDQFNQDNQNEQKGL